MFGTAGLIRDRRDWTKNKHRRPKGRGGQGSPNKAAAPAQARQGNPSPPNLQQTVKVVKIVVKR